jgi:hypothetical protein
MEKAHAHLQRFVADLIQAATKAGELKDGNPPDELARFALAAIAGAGAGGGKPTLKRLVALILRGLGA